MATAKQLFTAAYNGDLVTVKRLVEHAVDPNIRAKSMIGLGRTPLALCAAIVAGHTTVVQYLLQLPEIDVNTKDDDGNTPLHFAIHVKQAAMIELLVKHPRCNSINTKGADGVTPLMGAVYNSDVYSVWILLHTLGVDTDTRDNDGTSLMQLAEIKGHTTIVTMLKNHQKKKETRIDLPQRMEDTRNIEDLLESIEGGKKANEGKKKRKKKKKSSQRTQQQQPTTVEQENMEEDDKKEKVEEETEDKVVHEEDAFDQERDAEEDMNAEQKQEIVRFQIEETKLEDEVRVGEEEVAVHQTKVGEIISTKSKEMRIILVTIDERKDAKQKDAKKITEIDTMVTELEKRIKTLKVEKEELKQNIEHEDKQLKKHVKKKERLETYLDTTTKKVMTEGKRLETKVQSVRDQLAETRKRKEQVVRAAPPPSSQLPFLEFISGQIQEKEKELECPVFLETADTPIFSCLKHQHLVCQHCRPRLKECPECREQYAEVTRHRYAEKTVEQLKTLIVQRSNLLVGNNISQ